MEKYRYLPFLNGRYEVAAGFKQLLPDQKIFEIDVNYSSYLQQKQNQRTESLTKYYPQHFLTTDEQFVVSEAMLKKMALEYPNFFHYKNARFQNKLISKNFEHLEIKIAHENPENYRDLFDAACSQVQEDCAIWKLSEFGGTLAAIHLCFPNHWAAAEKINNKFNHIHSPVANFQKLAKAAPALEKQICSKGPLVRFAWGIATDNELNHHPENKFKGRDFDEKNPTLFVRVERQTTTPFPEHNLSLFTIKTYFLNCATDLNSLELKALFDAIESMDEAAQAYKGITHSRILILNWLKTLII